ncbi:hypothetical protein [Paenibacillus pinihumi]|uniref:hypothetical protein n=1 Tax=Paenibacillus pinihumi TaxID=669462 RepID=UPI00048E9D21|nr:hypothetical protein [Paenibacillus pinihumi]
MNYFELRNEIKTVRNTIEKLLEFLTNRTLKDLRTRRRSKEIDITDLFKDENPNFATSKDFFSVFREEVGVYLFEANFSAYFNNWRKGVEDVESSLLVEKWCEEIKKLWSGVEKSPAFYKSRALQHFVTEEQNKFRDDWVPLYVGKSMNVQNRVYEHIEGKSSMTYGMKLSHRELLQQQGIQFRVSYSPLEELSDDVMYKLVAVIENQVRAKYNPIIGRQ